MMDKFRVWNDVGEHYSYFGNPQIEISEPSGVLFKRLGDDNRMYLGGYKDPEWFTGATSYYHDENQELYENDIIEDYMNHEKYQVKWDDHTHQWRGYQYFPDGKFRCKLALCDILWHVIGNIHQSPELLTKED
jgi:hypothetical protein